MTLRYVIRPLGSWDGPRTPAGARRPRFQFRALWGQTLELLEYELEQLAATDIVLEADFREQDLRMDGMPRANARPPQDPAVRLAFESKHGHLVYQADGYDVWQHNIRAIALGLQALRAVDRYGITSRAQQYDGWRQIEAPSTGTLTGYRDAFKAIAALAGLGPAEAESAVRQFEVDPTVIRDLYRRALRAAHPDTGGTAAAFDRLTRARVDLSQRGLWPAVDHVELAAWGQRITLRTRDDVQLLSGDSR